MIELMTGLPEEVVGVSVSGQVTGEDYSEVLIPEIERKLQIFERIRLLYHLGPDFRKFTTTALWDDAKVGFHHLKDFERVAVVTDVEWIRKMVRAAGLAMPCELKTFADAELAEARTWIGAGNET